MNSAIKYFCVASVFFICFSVSAQTFNESKSKGDEFFKKKEWKSAIQQYKLAIAFTPDKYCTNQISVCEQKINEEKSVQGFLAFRNKGDENFVWKDYPIAKTNYEKANKLKRDAYCQSQIKMCDGFIAYQNGDYKSAESLLNSNEAKEKTVEVQLVLGKMRLQQGDEAKAIDWFKKAADAGNAEAMKNYGHLLFNTGKDDFGAIQWVEKGGGSSLVYYKRVGDKMWNNAKYDDAFIYYTKSKMSPAEVKNKCNDLGDILWKQQKFDEANRWYLQGGKEIKVKYYEEALKYIQEKKYDTAEEYLLKSATSGYSDAYIALGDMYWDGLSVNIKDNNKYSSGLIFYEKGGYPKINEKVLIAANMSANDKSTLKYAESLLNRIIIQNLKDKTAADAYYSLGIMYWDDKRYFKRDFNKAEKYFTASSDLNNMQSMKTLAGIYFEKKKYEEAYLWYDKYNKLINNDADVNYALGTLILEKNIKGLKNAGAVGADYIIKAAQMGHKEAVQSLKDLSKSKDYPAAKKALDSIKK